MNRYEIKIHDKSGIYKTTINPNLVMSDINFTENINGGQGQLKLNLALGFGDKTFNGGEIVRIFLYNERYKSGKQIYSGFVSQISRIYDINKGYIQITCLGIASLLNSVLFSGSYAGSVETILTSIISEFNNKYSGNLISIGQIDEYSGNLSVNFENDTTCTKAINQINEITNYCRYIDPDGKFYFREKFTQTNHIVANQQVVENMNLNYNIESIVNKIYVQRKDGTIKSYEDQTSQNLYGLKELFSKQDSIVNETTQDEFGSNYLIQYANPKNASTIVINKEYDIESIIPGDTITVVNTEYSIKNLLIEKITYTPTKITLILEENESLRGIISD